jgi:hypothetical protein
LFSRYNELVCLKVRSEIDKTRSYFDEIIVDAIASTGFQCWYFQSSITLPIRISYRTHEESIHISSKQSTSPHNRIKDPGMASNRSDPRWPHFLIGRLPAMTMMKAGDLFGTGLPEHVRISYRCPLPSPLDSHDTLESQRLPSIRWGLQVPPASPSYRMS